MEGTGRGRMMRNNPQQRHGDLIKDELIHKYSDFLDLLQIGSAGDYGVILDSIIVKKEHRNTGIGSQIMQDLVDYADAHGLIVAASPASDFGGSKARIIDFNKRFGFKPNKGRYKDFRFRDTMIRQPQSVMSNPPQEPVEEILYEDDYCVIFTVTPELPGPYHSDWPVRLIHFTDSMQDAESIVRNGFDLRKFKRTAKKFSAKKYLWEFDPRGVYANLYSEGSEIYAPRPYVVFDAPIHRALMFTRKDPSGDCGKKAIAALFGATGTQLQKKLLRNEIDAVSSLGGEQIILDPSTIEIVKWGDAKR